MQCFATSPSYRGGRDLENCLEYLEVWQPCPPLVLTTEEPKYLYRKLSEALQLQNERSHNFGTRHCTIQAAAPRLALISTSWLCRVEELYRRLPRDIVGLPRDIVGLPLGGSKDQLYKNKSKTWVVTNC